MLHSCDYKWKWRTVVWINRAKESRDFLCSWTWNIDCMETISDRVGGVCLYSVCYTFFIVIEFVCICQLLLVGDVHVEEWIFVFWLCFTNNSVVDQGLGVKLPMPVFYLVSMLHILWSMHCWILSMWCKTDCIVHNAVHLTILKWKTLFHVLT